MSGGGPVNVWELVALNVVSTGTLFCGIALCVRVGQAGRTRRREMQHVEQMKALELGRSADAAEAERFRALGAIGVVVPIFTMVAAIIGSQVAIGIAEPGWRFAALAVVWVASAVTCSFASHLIVGRLREATPADRPPDDNSG